MSSLPERYVLLALRLGRLVDGLVDSSFGPTELVDAAAAGDPPDAADLRREALELLAELEASALEPARRAWLVEQVGGLDCVAQLAAGEQVPWREVVRRCYGLELEPTPEAELEGTHRELDALVPGRGDLADRMQRWNESQHVPPEKLLDAFTLLAEDLRARTRELVDLPDGERFDATLVEGHPWTAYNWYLGGLASRIELNTDLPLRSYFLPVLVAHEGYPGHHTEHACKEARLLREQGRVEASLSLIHTPECLVSEGVAELALEQALGAEWPLRVAPVMRRLGIPFDVERAGPALEAHDRLRAVDVNLALFVGEDGWSREQAVAYHRRWGLSEEARAERAYDFDTDPLWGAYVVTYLHGHRLVGRYAARDRGNFRRLLTEQVPVAELVAADALAG